MNVLGLVFSILMILSYGFYACMDKHAAGTRLRNTYAAYQQTNRKILNSFESQVYENLNRQKAAGSPDTGAPQEEEIEQEASSEPPPPKKPDLNRDCARINLHPLLLEGRENHPILYELAAKLIRTFYKPLDTGEKRFEYHFLDVFLASAKAAWQEEGHLSLEKLALLDPGLQRVYYKMLRGTKSWNLRENIGYPPLLDYVKAIQSEEKICLFHAHPDLITVLFNSKIGWKLYEEIHQNNPPALTIELVEKVCSEMHQISVDKDLLELLEFGYPVHKEHKKAFIAEDGKGNVSLRKNLYLDS